jgi:hypothetical protein
MAGKKGESGRKPSGGKSVPDTSRNPVMYQVTNTARQPREFKLSGKWYRWEPRGQQGDSVLLEDSIVKKPDFKGVAQYFTLKQQGA